MKARFTYCLILISFLSSNIAFSQYAKLFDFDFDSTGASPYYGSLVSDGTYFYGTTTDGGPSGNGVVYKIKNDGSEFSVIHDFLYEEGYTSFSSLVFAGDYLYGTTAYGGADNSGTIFRVKPDGTDFSVLMNFDGLLQGGQPSGSLYYDGSMLYGMTTFSGANFRGTIYKIAPDGSGFSVIFDFLNDGSTGATPYAHLISDGTYLYGMTIGGGSLNTGAAFRIKPDGTEYLTLVDFTGSGEGVSGMGGMVYDGTEYLYAMTSEGGDYTKGIIFKVRTDGTGYEKLLDFNGINGAKPLGSFVLVDNTLYGTTSLSGEDGLGNVFSIGTDGNDFTPLVDFDGDNGGLPLGTLLYEDGVLYGTTSEFGLNDAGVIFSYGVPTAVEESMIAAAISIYPNPMQDYCTVQLPAEFRDCMMQISNAQGSVIRNERLTAVTTRLDLHSLPIGVYTIKIQKFNDIVVKRFIVE